MLRPASANWSPPVITASALHKEGIAEFWENIENYRKALTPTGEFEQKRKHQALAWMWQMIETGLHQQFRDHPGVQASLSRLSRSVEDGQTTPAAAAHALLAHLKH
jgi:LAO/AO transport system kinase